MLNDAGVIGTTDEFIKNLLSTTPENLSFSDLFKAQECIQLDMISKGLYDGLFVRPGFLPCDNVDFCSYHIQQLMSEIGEVLNADKRWKNFRNIKYDRDEKINEIADCFIVLMNIAMYSGINYDEMVEAIINKISKVNERIKNE